MAENRFYDKADRGVQLFPDAQKTYVAGNVIDGNGQGVVFSRVSSNNVVENNLISNPVVRYNIEDFELTGRGNVARRKRGRPSSPSSSRQGAKPTTSAGSSYASPTPS